MTHSPSPVVAADALFEQALALHRADCLPAADALYQQALAVDPGHGPSLHMAGMVAFQRGDSGLCLSLLERALAGGYRTAALFDHYGVVKQRAGDVAGAIESYRAGLALDPGSGGLWFNLGVAEREAGRLDSAIEALRHAAARLGQAFAEHALGLALQEAGLPQEAAAAYRRALALDPAHAASALNAGVIAQQSGDLAAAVALYRQALASGALGSEATLLAARVNLASALQESGNLQEAADEFRTILAESPDRLDALSNLGATLRSLGDPLAAEALFRRALALDPFHAAASDNLTKLLLDGGRADEAVGLRRARCAAGPADPRAWLELARVLGRTGGDEAGALVQALALDPGLAETHSRLGDCAQARRDWQGAAAHYRNAARLAPWRPEPLLGLALAALKAGDGPGALAACETLLALDRFDQCAIAYRALALRQTGREAEADELTDPGRWVSALPMDMAAPALDGLAAALRAVRHRAFAPPGQSVRGGTQTENDLFAEPAPEIQTFRESLSRVLTNYLAARPRDAAHPFLAARPERLHYHSWSVVLRAGGHHVPHIHPGGCISGVFYVAVPGGLDGAEGAGCLDIGRPGIDIPLPAPPPSRLICPAPGLLVLFPSYVWHGTRAFAAPGERITIAFDVRYGARALPSTRW